MKKSGFRIIGIDPGTATTGYAVIEKKLDHFKILDFGIISTEKTQSDSKRLLILQKDIKKLVSRFKPDAASVERLYYKNNAKTAMAVSQARGVVLSALEEKGMPISEFTPLQVKSIICGYGKAEKKQIQFVIQKMFGLKTLPKPDDAADALGIALCAGMKSV